jgi:hypothetical protein
VKLQVDNIGAIKKNMETLIDSSKEVGLEINTEKTTHMYMLFVSSQECREKL